MADLKGCLVLGQAAPASIWLLPARPAMALLSRSLNPYWGRHVTTVISYGLSFFLSLPVVSQLSEQETKDFA